MKFKNLYPATIIMLGTMLSACGTGENFIAENMELNAKAVAEASIGCLKNIEKDVIDFEEVARIKVAVTVALMENKSFPVTIAVDGKEKTVVLDGIEINAYEKEVLKVTGDFLSEGAKLIMEDEGEEIHVILYRDDETLQEILLSSGLAELSSSLPVSYEDKFEQAMNSAIEKKISLYSDYENAGWVESETEAYTMYSTGQINVRSIPSSEGEVILKLSLNEEIKVIKEIPSYGGEDSEFVRIEGDRPLYVSKKVISSTKTVILDNPVVAKPVNPLYSYELPVTLIRQKPELPNGCEVTSLTTVLNYAGYNIDKCDLSDNYLPKWPDLSGNPEYYFLREPRTNGFYCFAGALETCIDNYNAANGTTITYFNLTGSEPEALYEQIKEGHPVVVWGTLRWRNPVTNALGLYTNLHCMVLSGFTDTTVTITDPIYGDEYKTIDRANFETVYRKMGQRALVAY